MVLSGCASVHVASQWAPGEVKLGGKNGEWAAPQAESKDLRVQALNDGKFLYLRVSTDSQALKSQLLGAFRQSFTLWLDPDGTFRQPLGLKLSYIPHNDYGLPRRPEAQARYLALGLRQAAVLPPGRDPLFLNMESTDLVVDMDRGWLFLDWQVPLGKDDAKPYSLPVQPGQTLFIRLETSALPRQDRKSGSEDEGDFHQQWAQANGFGGQEGQRGQGGREGGGGMGRRTGGRHGGGTEGSGEPEALDLGGTIQLATEPR
jgi:hypothetical protein